MAQQWPYDSALKTGRRQLPGSILDHACRPSRSEFSLVFSETRVNTGQDPLERPPRRALHSQAQVPSETIGLVTNNQLSLLREVPGYPICEKILLADLVFAKFHQVRNLFIYMPLTMSSCKLFLMNSIHYKMLIILVHLT